jgi:DnaJ-class molecular chaperone
LTKFIKNLLSEVGYVLCDNCDGSGEISTFSGHEVEEDCPKCNGIGVELIIVRNAMSRIKTPNDQGPPELNQF